MINVFALILLTLALAWVLPGLIAADELEPRPMSPATDAFEFPVCWSGYTEAERARHSGVNQVLHFTGDWPVAQCQYCGAWFDTQEGAVFHVLIAHRDDPRTEARHACTAV